MLGVCFLAGWVQVDLAARKSFNEDEAFQHVVTCPESYSSILIHGGKSQCSPPPLYYLLQKTYLKMVPKDERVPVTFRGLSLASGVATAGLLFWVVSHYLGFVPALFSALLLQSQPIFHQFSEESRPYAFWSLLFLGWLIALRTHRRASQFGLALGLTGVSAAGMLQAVGGWAGEAVARFFERRELEAAWKFFRPYVLPVILLLAVGVYYAWGGCPPVDSEWNLLQTRSPDLVLFVWRLLFPSGPLYYTGVLNAVVAFGLVLSVYRVLKRTHLSGSWEYSLGFQLFIQILIAGVAGVAVAVKGYFFVPRMFIYLVVVRALLGAIGLHAILSRIRSKTFLRVLLPGVAAGLIGLTVAKTAMMRNFLRQNNELETPFRVAEGIVPCGELLSAREVWMRKGLTAGQAANTWVAALQEQARCKNTPTQPPKSELKLLLNGPNHPGREYVVSQEADPETFEVYLVNGEPVPLSR
jgi:hypothetical protein